MGITLDEFLLNVRIADGLDVLILSIVISLVWRWLQQRATRSVVLALLGLGALYVVSRAFNMYLTVAVFQAGLTVMLFALVVIFQDDLRRAVERISSWRLSAPPARALPAEQFVDTLVETATLLAKENMGALIILPGRQPLDRHIRGGIKIDGLLSVELLHSIFHPGSRGHDGGVLLRHNRVDRLGVHLPLSANLKAIGNRGTRHTAALGLAERTDAVVIVVSEERGTIALARGAVLVDIATPAELESQLLAFIEGQMSRLPQPAPSRGRLRMLRTQLGSFAIALMLWFVFAFRVETVQRTIDDVPVELRNLPEEWMLQGAEPNRVKLTLVGPERAFDALDPSKLKAAVNLRGISEGQTATPIREDHLNLPEDIHLLEADPPMLRFQLDRMTTLTLPIDVRIEGRLPEGLNLVALTAEPEMLTVRVSSRQRDRIDRLSTEPVDLTTVRETTTVTTPVTFPQGIQTTGDADRDVQVRIEVGREPEPMPPADDIEPRNNR